MPSSTEPVHKGTLVCVVLKAKNLPNKRSIGKQDPYCVLGYEGEQQKTKPDKRGGQHPTWDEQLHFEIYDDMEDALKKTSAAAKAKGGAKVLKVACYADDSKEPELIGEGMVDLTDTLRTGEFDEWVTIKAKDRYAGEVYLELTFYSSAAPPKKKKVIQPQVSGTDTYGGAGTFEGIDGLDEPPAAPPKNSAPSIPSSMRPGGLTPSGAGRGHRHQMSSSASYSSFSTILPGSSMGMTSSSTMADIPSSLRPSTSLAHFSAYTPPYAPPAIERVPSPAQPPLPSKPSDGLTEFGQNNRRASWHPPPLAPEPSMSSHPSLYGQAHLSSQGPPPQHHQEQSHVSDPYGTIKASASYHHLSHSQSMSLASSADELSHSMSTMSVSRWSEQQPPHPVPSVTYYPPDQTQAHPPPPSHIYQHPSQPSTYQPQYQAPPPSTTPIPPSYPQHTHTPQPSAAAQIPATAHNQVHPPPPSHAQGPYYAASGGHQVDGLPPRPVSPAARPSTSMSSYPPPAPAPSSTPTPSVINAQAYYQSNAGSTLLPSSTGLPLGGRVPSPSPYGASYISAPAAPHLQGPPAGSNEGGRRTPRPLPPTQPPPSVSHSSPAPQPGGGILYAAPTPPTQQAGGHYQNPPPPTNVTYPPPPPHMTSQWPPHPPPPQTTTPIPPQTSYPPPPSSNGSWSAAAPGSQVSYPHQHHPQSTPSISYTGAPPLPPPPNQGQAPPQPPAPGYHYTNNPPLPPVPHPGSHAHQYSSYQ
ncbi:hypothetical protein IE53DRAFT_389512 [Violaceomyces palustris]|uniref:Uncharacterized protein n=1 Tax=Violaceomyces palustris TaxID=1673888 RepID=A0ACD0NR86_9BASI|nr:hypothetical protein IE53DRAFT_389512 [Violaceomyces palustris]